MGSLDKIEQIEGVTYVRLDADKNNTHRHAGVIAQQVEKVLPEVVHTDSKTGMKSVAYGNMSGLLIEAIKELNNKVKELQEQINQLKKE